MNMKQKKIKIELRIKLNYNIENIAGSPPWVPNLLPLEHHRLPVAPNSLPLLPPEYAKSLQQIKNIMQGLSVLLKILLFCIIMIFICRRSNM